MGWRFKEIIPGLIQFKAKTNYLVTNNYLLEFGDRALIDASLVPDKPVDVVILTHCHWDHIYALHELVEKYKPKVYAGWKDAEAVETMNEKTLYWFSDKKLRPVKIDIKLREGDIIDNGLFQLEVLETPGHTEGSISLWNEEKGLLFTGDTLFNGAVGRWDLPSGNGKQLWKSVERLEALPYRYLLPGHGMPVIR